MFTGIIQQIGKQGDIAIIHQPDMATKLMDYGIIRILISIM
jgi:hypothetical protein